MKRGDLVIRNDPTGCDLDGANESTGMIATVLEVNNSTFPTESIKVIDQHGNIKTWYSIYVEVISIQPDWSR